MKYLALILKVVEYIESNLNSCFRVEEVACLSGFSPYHFLRIFHSLTGETLGSYVRKRRLTEAANKLLNSKQSVIDIAFDTGFESQEAFSRAFKKYFLKSPALYRRLGQKAYLLEKSPFNINSVEHLIKRKITIEPQIIVKKSFRVIGVEGMTTLQNIKIGELWDKFCIEQNRINASEQTGNFYGVVKYREELSLNLFNEETEYSYLAGCEVDNECSVPDGLTDYIVPEQKYAVFTHKGTVYDMWFTFNYMYQTWLINSKYEIDYGDSFECYDQRFLGKDNPDSEIDIYIPIK